MTKQKADQFIAYLKSQQNRGRLWAVYDGHELPGDAWRLIFFESALQASSFCVSNYWSRDPEDGEMIEHNYRYHAIPNLIGDIQLAQEGSITLMVPPEHLNAMMTAAAITMDSTIPDELDIVKLATGRIMKGQTVFSVVPNELITSYHIVEHFHHFHPTIYEIGHSHRLQHSFKDKMEAITIFNEMAQKLPRSQDRFTQELWLVGLFRDQHLRLSDEGTPLDNTGTIISHAYISDGEKLRQDGIDSNVPIEFRQRFFIQFDQSANKIKCLDDKLNEFIPRESPISYRGETFAYSSDYERLTTALKKFISANAATRLQGNTNIRSKFWKKGPHS